MISNEKLFGPVGALWREYLTSWDVVLTGNVNKKVVKNLIENMKAIAAKALAQEQELAAHPLPKLPAILPVDTNALVLEGAVGQELYEKRSEGDCVVKVITSQGEHVTFEDAHMAQLAPFSNKFIFTKESPEAKKLTLTLTFDGSEEEFLRLLFFMYTGRIESPVYNRESIGSFGRAYGIDSLTIPLAAAAASSRDMLHTLQQLANASTVQELKERWQKLVDEGLPTSNWSTLYAVGRVLVRWMANHNQIENLEKEITPYIKYVESVYDTLYDGKPSFRKLISSCIKQVPSFDLTDTVSVNPFSRFALAKFAQINKAQALILSEPSRALYCSETEATILEDQDGFYGITIGQVTDAANSVRLYYLYTSQDNSKPLLVDDKLFLHPGSYMFMQTWPCQIEVSNAQVVQKKYTLSTHIEHAFIGIEECSYNQKIADVRASYRKIAQVAETIIEKGTQIVKNKGRADKDRVSCLKVHDLSLDALVCLSNVFAKFKYSEKKIGEAPPVLCHYIAALPKDCLVQQSLAAEPKVLFTFDDGSELILPRVAIKDKMIQADAGFNSNKLITFTLAGSANDFEHRVLIAYLKNEPLPNEQVSVNQIDALLALAEQLDMHKFLDQAKKFYLHAAQLTNKEPLNINSFKRLHRYNQYSILTTLLQREGSPKATDFIDRIVTLLPTPTTILNVEDNTLLQQLGERLVHVSGEIIVELLGWTKEKGYESIYAQLCSKLKVSANPFC